MGPSRGRREPICPSWGKKKKWGSIHYRMIWLYSELNYVETSSGWIRRPSHRKGIDSPSPADVILITSERSARRSNLPIRSCPMTTTRPAAGQNAHQSMHQRRRRGARLPNLLQWSIALHTYRVASGIILSCRAQGGMLPSPICVLHRVRSTRTVWSFSSLISSNRSFSDPHPGKLREMCIIFMES